MAVVAATVAIRTTPALIGASHFMCELGPCVDALRIDRHGGRGPNRAPVMCERGWDGSSSKVAYQTGAISEVRNCGDRASDDAS